MRHRIVNIAGFGNNTKELLDNVGELNKKFASDAVKTYFRKEEGFDFKVAKHFVMVGLEPGYQYERLKIVSICRDKKSSFRQGYAWGPYGSGIRSTTKYYSEYKTKCKFTKFVDKWHPILFPEGPVTQ